MEFTFFGPCVLVYVAPWSARAYGAYLEVGRLGALSGSVRGSLWTLVPYSASHYSSWLPKSGLDLSLP